MSGPGVVDQVDPRDDDQTLSASVLAALERTWTAIRRHHRDLPTVVVVLAAGSVGTPRGTLKLGHFAAMRWDHDPTTPADVSTRGEAMAEVFIGGEGLARGPVDVLGTLLHEAAHALAHVRQIQDTSRQGRYHNRRYAALAIEVGLDVTEIGDIGWSNTNPTPATRATYIDQIDALRTALTIHRRTEGAITAIAPDPGPDTGTGGPDTPRGAGGRASSNNGHSARCGCGRRIRVAPAVLALGPIACGRCGHPFTPTTPAGPDAPEAAPTKTEGDPR